MDHDDPSLDDVDAGRRVEVERIRRHADERGSVFEPLAPADIPRQRNVHVVLTEPGHVRGNHVHRRSTETLVVRGPARVRWRQPDQARDFDVDVAADKVVAFTIPPGVPHAIRNTGTGTGLIVAFRDIEHDPQDPDTEPFELL